MSCSLEVTSSVRRPQVSVSPEDGFTTILIRSDQTLALRTEQASLLVTCRASHPNGALRRYERSDAGHLRMAALLRLRSFGPLDQRDSSRRRTDATQVRTTPKGPTKGSAGTFRLDDLIVGASCSQQHDPSDHQTMLDHDLGVSETKRVLRVLVVPHVWGQRTKNSTQKTHVSCPTNRTKKTGCGSVSLPMKTRTTCELEGVDCELFAAIVLGYDPRRSSSSETVSYTSHTVSDTPGTFASKKPHRNATFASFGNMGGASLVGWGDSVRIGSDQGRLG